MLRWTIIIDGGMYYGIVRSMVSADSNGWLFFSVDSTLDIIELYRHILSSRTMGPESSFRRSKRKHAMDDGDDNDPHRKHPSEERKSGGSSGVVAAEKPSLSMMIERFFTRRSSTIGSGNSNSNSNNSANSTISKSISPVNSAPLCPASRSIDHVVKSIKHVEFV